MRRGRDERGAVTVLAVAVLGLLLLIGAALGVVSAMVVAHRRAQAAADLAALAGAAALQRMAEPCVAVGAIAAENDAVVSDCVVTGQDVVVTLEVEGPRWLGQHGALGAMARAGPETRGP